MAGMGRPGTTVQFCNPRQAHSSSHSGASTGHGTPGWGESGPMGDQSMRMVLLLNGEAENLNKVPGQP